jgi:hypothetical protein
MRVLGLALALALAACATTGEAVAPTPTAFRGVRSLALVRSVDERGHTTKDPLDGLEETLRARGFTTRVVELGPKPPPELATVERLFDQLELRAAAGRAERIARPMSSVGAEAGAAVAQLGVDAVASYHRLDRRRAPGVSALSAPVQPGSVFPSPPPPIPDRPLAAFVLVDRDGRAATFAWGDAGPIDDPAVPLNAAEAIDLLVSALTGEPREE